jgi:hypothetical protein
MSDENPEPKEFALLRLKLESVGAELLMFGEAKPPITMSCTDEATGSVDIRMKMDVDGQGTPYIVEMRGSATQLPPNLKLTIVDVNGKILERVLSK